MILLGCFEVPGYGGAATASYNRFVELQRCGLPVAYVNLIPSEHAGFLSATFGQAVGNPLLLNGVHNCTIQFPPFRDQPELAELLKRLGPNHLVGCGYIGAWLLHRMAPTLPLTFLTAGFRWAQDLISDGVFADFISLRDHLSRHGSDGLPAFHGRQREAFLAAQLVVTHADMIGDLYRLLFPDEAFKIHPQVLWKADTAFSEVEPFLPLSRPFRERELDLLFVASRWDRPEKNYPMVEAITSQCPDLRVGIAGVCQHPPPGCSSFGLISQRGDLMKIMGNSRVVVCPSIFDAAPGILYEAAAMGCNLVASQNCGNWGLLNPQLVAESFTADCFLEKCRLGVSRPLPDQRERFLTCRSHEALLDILYESCSKSC